MTRLVPGREAAIWAACFVAVAALLVAIGFTSDDPDSALYAALSARLADGPPSHWIRPEWWGHWDSEGLFREHPAGVFLLPAMLGALGVPGVQAAYIVGIAAGIASVLLIGWITQRATSREDARILLILIQLMPVAFIFRIRANHEYPMLVSLLLAVIGLDLVRRSWGWIWLTPVALSAALLVKGVFVVIPLIAVGLWIVLNPLRAAGSPWRAVAACLLSAVLMGILAVGYDSIYSRVAGETFWGPYWQRQLAPLTIATPVEGGSTILHHLWFYLIRVLWHPAPWSLALILSAWRYRGRLVSTIKALPETERRTLTFAVGMAFAVVLLLSPASRFAERYIFSANYAIAAAGVVVAARHWPSLRSRVERLDRRVPALPAWCWLVLMLLRLVVGPFLPRISS